LRSKDNPETTDTNNKKYGDFEIAGLVADYYLKNKKKSTSKGITNWGIIGDNIGYLQVNLMMGHANLNIPDTLTGNAYWQAYFGKFDDMTSEAHTKSEMEGLNTTLDKVMTDLNQAKAIVLDVRFNGGGKDEVAMEIIKRFNPEKHKVFNKKAKYDNGYTEPNYIYLNAYNKPYTKPVYLLTSQQSASATEIMVLSSLQLEHVTRVGDHTEGVFSDVLDKELPNGWEVGLSNEVYLDTKGNNYEGRGIPADIDLGYPLDRQEFFRSIAKDLEGDINSILTIVNKK